MGIKCTQYYFNAKTPRVLSIEGNTSDVTTTKLENNIVGVTFPDDYTLSLHDTITVNKLPYKINEIKVNIKELKPQYELITAPVNKSSMFLLPMLGGTRRLFMYDTLFVNAFIEVEQYKNCIGLLYRFSGDPLFLKFEKALAKFRSFKETFDPSPHFVMFVFDIPSNYQEDYVNFINGKYSKFSPTFKSKIMEFHSFNIYGEMAQVLFQDEKRRLRLQEELKAEIAPGSELLSIIDPKQETFNPKIYI